MITGEEALETKVYGARSRQTGIRFPQEGQRLAHGTNGVRHRSAADRSSVGSNGPVSVAMGKEKEGTDGVRDGLEVGIEVEGGAEGAPEGPCAVGTSGAGGRDAIGNI